MRTHASDLLAHVATGLTTRLQAAAITGCIAFGPRAGQKKPAPSGAMPRKFESCYVLCADTDGGSLHAVAVRCEGTARKPLEQLCRHITRPPLSDERCRAKLRGR